MKLTHEIVGNLQVSFIVIEMLLFAGYLAFLAVQPVPIKRIAHIVSIFSLISLPILIAILPGFIDG